MISIAFTRMQSWIGPIALMIVVSAANGDPVLDRLKADESEVRKMLDSLRTGASYECVAVNSDYLVGTKDKASGKLKVQATQDPIVSKSIGSILIKGDSFAFVAPNRDIGDGPEGSRTGRVVVTNEFITFWSEQGSQTLSMPRTEAQLAQILDFEFFEPRRLYDAMVGFPWPADWLPKGSSVSGVSAEQKGADVIAQATWTPPKAWNARWREVRKVTYRRVEGADLLLPVSIVRSNDKGIILDERKLVWKWFELSTGKVPVPVQITQTVYKELDGKNVVCNERRFEITGPQIDTNLTDDPPDRWNQFDSNVAEIEKSNAGRPRSGLLPFAIGSALATAFLIRRSQTSGGNS